MLITVLAFLFVLSILVLIHELGHFTAAKKLGIKVEEFGLGFPPRIFGIKYGETVYSLNLLPIGGFVRIFGEDGAEVGSSKDKKRSFYNRPLWQKAIVIGAGVVMNFILAVAIVTFLFTRGVMVPVDRVHLDEINEDSPADMAGLKKGDVIEAVNGEKITTTEEFKKITREQAGQKIEISILRGAILEHYGERLSDCVNCESLQVYLIPRKDPPLLKMEENEEKEPSFFCKAVQTAVSPFQKEKVAKTERPLVTEGPVGAIITNYETRVYSWYEAPFSGIKKSLKLSWEFVKVISGLFVKLITFQQMPGDIAGPIGIAQMTGTAVGFGGLAILELMGSLSLSLAIVNIFPFPALDGGRLLFIVIEGITGKKLKADIERYVHQIGMVLLLLLLLLVTMNDLLRIITGCLT